MVGFVSWHQIWLQMAIDITNQRCLSTQTGFRTKTLSGLSKGTETNTIYIYVYLLYIYTDLAEERNKHDINPWETWSIHHKWHKLMPNKYISIQALLQKTHISSNGRCVYLDFLNCRWITLLIMNRTASCTSISSLQHHGHLWTPMMYQSLPMKIPGGCIHTTSLFETPTQRRALDKTVGTFLLVSSMYFKPAYVLHMSFTHM